MARYILQRLLLLIPTLLGVLTIVFFMTALSPGDPARVMLGERANAQQLEQLREDLGLNKPLGEQYLIYLKRTLRLDFGRSIRTGRSVMEEIREHFPATIELALVSMFLATFFGIVIGVLSAVKQNTWLDYSAMIGALTGVSMPVFWLGLVLIMIFSVGLGWFPTGGRMEVRLFFEPITRFYLLDSLIILIRDGDPAYLKSSLQHIILPAVALGTIPIAIIARTTRSSMLETLRQDYVKTARAAGIHERRVIFRYALKNALLPVVTVIGLQFGLLLAGAILTETIFAWPGIGRWIYSAITARDYPAVQAGVIIVSAFFVGINVVVDILYSVINPKIRLR
ncbi:MAG: ABC transporter permease [Spirochaetales bacterium]|nr:ABC transporter permease [Spirochaetales bacterium]